jgi:hypothetical protein
VTDDDEFALQTRCLHCLGEQYALSVYFVSTGDQPCAWCGAYSKKMSQQEYDRALRDAGVEPPPNLSVILPRPRKPAD